MSGSITKHITRDGRTTWRVRVDVVDASGNRHQPQRWSCGSHYLA